MKAALAIAAGCALSLCFGATARATTVSCSTHGLQRSIVRIRAEGVECDIARSAAARVARELAHGSAIAVPGSNGLALASVSCTGCPFRTKVSLGYPSGSVTVTLKGRAPHVTMPKMPTLPTSPALPDAVS